MAELFVVVEAEGVDLEIEMKDFSSIEANRTYQAENQGGFLSYEIQCFWHFASTFGKSFARPDDNGM